RGGAAGLGKNDGKLIAAVARGSINGAATVSHDASEPAERLVSGQMAELIINMFQAVEVEEKKREFTAGTLGAGNFRMQHLEKLAVIGQPGQRIAGGLKAQLILKRALV